MARLKSPEKRSAILHAAVYEIAESGLSAPTAKIARRAGIAEGSLFTYFADKEELLNELYLDLKFEVYARLNSRFPRRAGLERCAWHIWSTYLDWAIEFPEKRRASILLNLSNVITPETRARTLGERSAIDATLSKLENRAALRGLPAGFAAAMITAMQEATMDFISRQPRRRKQLIDRAFRVFWRALR